MDISIFTDIWAKFHHFYYQIFCDCKNLLILVICIKLSKAEGVNRKDIRQSNSFWLGYIWHFDSRFIILAQHNIIVDHVGHIGHQRLSLDLECRVWVFEKIADFMVKWDWIALHGLNNWIDIDCN